MFRLRTLRLMLLSLGMLMLIVPLLAREPRHFPADWMVLDSVNRPMFIAQETGADFFTLVRCDDPICTTHTEIRLYEADVTQPRQTVRLALSRLDHPVLAYQTPDMLIKLIVCHDPLCENVASTVVDGVLPPHTLGTPLLALDSVDYPVITYFDSQAQGIKLVYCGDKLCQSRRVTLISQMVTPPAMAMMLGRRDAPILAVRNDAGALNLVICDSLLCEAPFYRTLDDTRPVGDFLSIIVNEFDVPTAAYIDSAENTLHLALCDDAACKHPLTTPIPADTVISQPLLTLTPNGLPMVFYTEGEPPMLKLAVCNDAFCVEPVISTVDATPYAGMLMAQSYNEGGNDILLYAHPASGLMLLRCNDGRCTAPESSVIAP